MSQEQKTGLRAQKAGFKLELSFFCGPFGDFPILNKEYVCRHLMCQICNCWVVLAH